MAAIGRTRIKICGVRDAETAFVAAECGADAVGFVLATGSPRTIDPDDAWDASCDLPPFVGKVGVVVDRSPEQLDSIRERFPFDYAQLHGSEPEGVVRDCGPDVIKAVRFDAGTIKSQFERWSKVEEVCAVLVDGPQAGSGDTIDWHALADCMGSCAQPVILAGGLTPENVGEAIRTVRPWGVDVSSGVESERGVKDPSKIAAFCRAVREADAG